MRLRAKWVVAVGGGIVVAVVGFHLFRVVMWGMISEQMPAPYDDPAGDGPGAPAVVTPAR